MVTDNKNIIVYKFLQNIIISGWKTGFSAMGDCGR